MHEIGGTPQENPGEYALRSPISYMSNVETPVLLLHHEGDLRCPIGQSEEIFHALKALGNLLVRQCDGFEQKFPAFLRADVAEVRADITALAADLVAANALRVGPLEENLSSQRRAASGERLAIAPDAVADLALRFLRPDPAREAHPLAGFEILVVLEEVRDLRKLDLG